MRNTAAIIFFATVLSGCVSINKQAIDPKATADIKGQTVTYVTRAKPDFGAMTAGKMTFGLFGAMAMISDGNSIVAKNNIADPADAISAGLASLLEKSHGAIVVAPPAAVATDDVAQIAGSVKNGARFIIDVKTINWSFIYFSTDWTHYRVLYTAKVRLLNAQTKSVVAEGGCQHVPPNTPTPGAPTYDELLANDATRLKSELAAIAVGCVNTLKAEMLSL